METGRATWPCNLVIPKWNWLIDCLGVVLGALVHTWNTLVTTWSELTQCASSSRDPRRLHQLLSILQIKINKWSLLIFQINKVIKFSFLKNIHFCQCVQTLETPCIAPRSNYCRKGWRKRDSKKKVRDSIGKAIKVYHCHRFLELGPEDHTKALLSQVR